MAVLILTCPKCEAKTPVEAGNKLPTSFTCAACGAEHKAECLCCSFGKEGPCTEHSSPEIDKKD